MDYEDPLENVLQFSQISLFTLSLDPLLMMINYVLKVHKSVVID